MATHTQPGPWFLEDERTVITVLAILEERAEAMEQATKGRR